MPFKLPPLLYNKKGKLRKVGFEREFSIVEIKESAGIIRERYGGEVQKENRFSQKVVAPTLSDFSVAFDLTLRTEKNYKKVSGKFNLRLEEIKRGEGTLEKEVETMPESRIEKVVSV